MKSAEIMLSENVILPSLEIGAFEALWSNGISSFKQLRDKLTDANQIQLSKLVDRETAEIFYEKVIKKLNSSGINRFGVRIDTTLNYPEKLYDADYPLVLIYYMGNWDLVYSKGVAVVGTRRPTDEGVKRAKILVKGLVKAGYTIYSGLAQGIDTVAHQSAIENGGKTIAVIGTPLWMTYPKENTPLQKAIAKDHLLISQIPVLGYKEKGIQTTRMFFPERNKTMSALSEATIIVEAGETSGTLTQARAALKQGRKVFILNNNFENKLLTWPSKFEKLGAIKIKTLDEILEHLSDER